jgi:rhodanese-related sulfurtransferase
VKLLLDAGEDLFIVDLRPAKEFHEKRIPGARSIPLSDLQRRLREIPKTGRVIFYSWMERNQTLDEVSQLFEDNGYRNVAMLLEGFQAWVKHNYPVERGRR